MRRPRKSSTRFVDVDDENEKKKKKMKKKKWNSFIKIIHLSIIQNRRLELPRDFVRKFGKELTDVASVMVPCGTKWHVKLRKTKGAVWFENGWREFMDYYSIGVGHFLIFRYDGNSHFHVIIFDTSACEIEYPYHTKDAKESNHERVCRAPATEESDSVEILDVRFRCLNCARREGIDETQQKARVLDKRNESNSVENDRVEKFTFNIKDESGSEGNDEPTMTTQRKSSSSRAGENCCSTKKTDTRTSPSNQKLGVQLKKGKLKRHKTDKVEAHDLKQEPRKVKLSAHRVNRRAETARADAQITRKPFCMVSAVADSKERAIEAARAFKSENPSCMIIMLPTYVYTGYVSIPSDFAREYLKQKPCSVILRVSPGRRTWHVGCFYIKTYTRLSNGWKQFVADNLLEEGDICVFELVDRKKFKMNVTIFRVFMDMV